MKSRLFANGVLIAAALLASSGALLVSPLLDSRANVSRQWVFSAALLGVAAIFLLCLRLPLAARISLSVTLLSAGSFSQRSTVLVTSAPPLARSCS